MKIYLDDERTIFDPTWTVVRDPYQCIKLLKKNEVTHLSLDHDLGENTLTGYDVVKWIENQVALNGFVPPKMITVHSANPVGRSNMEAAIKSIRRFEKLDKTATRY